MGLITLIVSLLMGLLTLAPASSQRGPIEAVTAQASAPVAAAMPEPDSMESEIYTVLDYGRGIFLPGQWRASAEEQDSRTNVTYRSTGSSSLVIFSYLHFPGRESDFTVPDYIRSDYFGTALGYFNDLKRVGECSDGDLYLYEFIGRFRNLDYDIRYWAQFVTPERMLTVSMNFEATERADLDGYAETLFPSLPTCAPAE